jgi:hypothetical protein
MHLFHVVDIEGWHTEIIFGSVIEQLTHGYQGHDGLLGVFSK